METETFECSHKRSFASRDGGGKYSIYVTKDDGTDMTVYGEAIGAEGWQKGARLKVTAQPARKNQRAAASQQAAGQQRCTIRLGEAQPEPIRARLLV